MHASGDYSITDLTELFSVSRPTVYRTCNEARPLRVLRDATDRTASLLAGLLRHTL